MIAALDRHLRENQYPLLIVKEEFLLSGRSCRERRNYYDRLVEVSAQTKFDKRRRRSAMEGEQARKYNPR